MNEREIRGIRKKFILVSTLSFFGVMLLMGGFIYLFSEITLRNEVRQIMRYIVENDGELPHDEEQTSSAEQSEQEVEDTTEQMIWDLGALFGTGNVISNTPDFVYTTRYFAVLFDAEGTVEKIATSHIAYVDETQAEQYARIAMKRWRTFGSFGRYYYRVAERESGGTIVIYLDRTAQVAVNSRILFATLALLGFGTLLAFALMRVFSAGIVRTEVRNAEKQKQFITNASHELKTPLAVIRANTEMQEMLSGENEWTQSTLRQVSRMDGLIRNLVMIARSREQETSEMVVQDVSGAVRETAESFRPVAAGDGKDLQTEIAEHVFLKTDESIVRQLTALLTDNAVKYCDAGGCVRVKLEKTGKTAALSVSNPYAAGETEDYSRFFDRFYRSDASHNTEKGGYGVGLSIAEGLTETMRGTIGVSWRSGEITFTCRFPLQKVPKTD